MKPKPRFVFERKGKKRRRRIASVDTPFNFNVSQTSKKIDKWRLGSSNGEPPNCDCWTMDMSADLNSKLLTSTVGRAILDEIPWTPGVMKSRSVLLWPPAPASIFGDSSWALRLFSSLYFLLLIWKVFSISGSGLYANRFHIKRKIFLQAQH